MMSILLPRAAQIPLCLCAVIFTDVCMSNFQFQNHFLIHLQIDDSSLHDLTVNVGKILSLSQRRDALLVEGVENDIFVRFFAVAGP